tara:strand:+ start:6072 stop:6476 length:405 start_codon:yes stop_codon:yes gene_type:complete
VLHTPDVELSFNTMPAPCFLQSLRFALDNPKDDQPIQWVLLNGRWCVQATEKFEPCQVLPGSRAISFGTFLRQLHNYGFVSCYGRGKEGMCWHNQYFRKDVPDMMRMILPRKRPKKRKRTSEPPAPTSSEPSPE